MSGPLERIRKALRGLAEPTPIVAVTREDASGGSEQQDERPTPRAEPQRAVLYVPLDYESIVPREKSRAPFPALIRLFEEQLPEILRTWKEVSPWAELCQVPDEAPDDVSPYWKNDFFTGADAKVAYGFIRLSRPARILEIGSGNSTRFFRKAIVEGGLSTKIVSIDPHPRVEIERIADEIMPISVVDAPLDVFADLMPGDILFFDGSHLCFHGTDVTHFFLNILPRVREGVLVHIHDIRLPYEYPEHFDSRYYNEQYVLGAFLLGNSEWRTLLPVHFLAERGILGENGASFWMTRRPASGWAGLKYRLSAWLRSR